MRWCPEPCQQAKVAETLQVACRPRGKAGLSGQRQMGCRRRYSPRCRHDPARLPVSREPSRLARGLGALCDELAFHLIVGSALARTHRGPRHLHLALQELVVFPFLALALDALAPPPPPSLS